MNQQRDIRGQLVEDDETIALMEHPDSTEDIPTLDFAPYLDGRDGGLKKVAADLREISKTVGFFYLKNHGISEELIANTFAQARRFHNLPEDKKEKIPWDGTPTHKTGYHPVGGASYEKTNVAILANTKPNQYSQFSFAIEPGARAELNNWPEDLPGFREKVLSYSHAIKELALQFLPLWCKSLNLPLDYLDPYFKDPFVQTGLLRYPPQLEVGDGLFGITPHTDNALMTFLATSEVAGLAVRMPSGHWRKVAHVPGALVVNTGNSMVAWTNEEYLSTKHLVINTNTIERYSIPTFFGPQSDTVIEALPTCVGPNRPPLYKPIKYIDMMSWYYGGEKKWLQN